MFTVEQRDSVRDRLLSLAEGDVAVVGAARVCIRRRRWWQAEQWISALRGHILALACLRLGHPTTYAKGAHLLPDDLTAPLTATLVRSLDEAELTRALDAAASALIAEIACADPALSGRLAPILGASATDGGHSRRV